MMEKKRIAHIAIMLQSETQLSPHYEIKEASTSTAAPPQNCSLPFTVFAGQKSTDYTLTHAHGDLHVCACRRDTDTEKAAGKKWIVEKKSHK